MIIIFDTETLEILEESPYSDKFKEDYINEMAKVSLFGREMIKELIDGNNTYLMYPSNEKCMLNIEGYSKYRSKFESKIGPAARVIELIDRFLRSKKIQDIINDSNI